MAKKTDLRVQRTQKMLKDAFIELLGEIGFQKITVDNLTKRAFVSRNTFYLHYKDKYEMLDNQVDEVLAGLKSFMMEAPLGEPVGPTPEYVLQALTYIKQNKEIFLLLSGKKGDLTFFRRLQQMMRTVILEREFDARLKIPASYAVAFISGAFSGIIGEWLAGGLKDPPEMLAQMISTIISTLSKGIMVMKK